MREAKFNKPLCVAFSPDVYDKIKKISDERHIAMAEYVREIIQKALTEISNTV